MRLPGIFAPLPHRDFRLLWTGQSVSRFGDAIFVIALPLQLLALGASPLELGAAATIAGSTHLALVLVGGAVADRVPRRRLILTSDLAAGAAVAVLALLSWAGALQIAHIYIASVIFGAGSAFLGPAYSALIPELVPKDVLQAGNAARSLSRSLGHLAGPAIGGLAVASGGPALGFGIDALTFFFSFGAMLLVRAPQHEPPLPAPLLRQVREGLRFTIAMPWLLWGAAGYGLLNLGSSGEGAVLTPLLVRDVLGGGATTFGAINAAFGAGAIVGGILLAQVTVRRSGIAIYILESLAGLAVLTIGLVPSIPVVLGLMFFMGVTMTGSSIIWEAARQRHVPREMLGRVTSITSLGSELAGPIAPLVAALVVEAVGPVRSFVAFGLFMTAVSTLLLLASPMRHVR